MQLSSLSSGFRNHHLYFTEINRYAKGSHNGWEGLVGLEAGYDLGWDATPFVRVDYIYLSRQGFNEIGADSLNLNVIKHHDQVIQSELGFIWTTCYDYCSGTLVPRVKLSYVNEAPITNRIMHEAYSDCEFAVRGINFKRNLGVASLGLTYLNCDETLAMTFQYDG